MFLVTDPWLVESGLAGAVAAQLTANGLSTTTYSGVQPDPTDVNVLDGLAAYVVSGATADRRSSPRGTLAV